MQLSKKGEQMQKAVELGDQEWATKSDHVCTDGIFESFYCQTFGPW
jgi:hypothetical protein